MNSKFVQVAMVALVAVAAAWSGPSVYAQEETGAPAGQERSCTALQSRLEALGSRTQSIKEHKVGRYRQMHARLVELTARLQNRGYDTGALEAAGEVLAGKIDVLETNYDGLTSTLEQAQADACTESQGTIRNMIQVEAREFLDAARVARDDIREFFVQTVKTEVRNLVAQAKDPTPSPEGE